MNSEHYTSPEPSDSNTDQTKKRRLMKKREKFVIGVLVILCALLGVASFYGYQMVTQLTAEIAEIKEAQKHQRANQIETNQLLLSTMDWSTRRQKQILFMRDMIISEWKRIGEKERVKRGITLNLGEAYYIADNIVANTEIYPNIDPLLILALSWKESAFWRKARSFKGALGIMQVMPATARPYFDLYGISFSQGKLYDPATNIKIGTRFFDDVFASYETLEKTLAYYNGGRWGAAYYPDSLDKCHEETKDYVPKVLAKFEEYKELYKSFRIDSSMVPNKSKRR